MLEQHSSVRIVCADNGVQGKFRSLFNSSSNKGRRVDKDQGKGTWKRILDRSKTGSITPLGWQQRGLKILKQ